MFLSIRWRLVASYTLIAILAVVLVGVLALFLVERYLLRQERHYLMTSAGVVAEQIEPLLSMPLAQPALVDVVRTTAFLNDVQVRILDENEDLLIDSGLPSPLNEMTVLPARVAALRIAGQGSEAIARPGFFVQILPDATALLSEPASAQLALPLLPRWSSLAAVPSLSTMPAKRHMQPMQADTPLLLTTPLSSTTSFSVATPVVAKNRIPWATGVRAFLGRLFFEPQRVVQAVDDGEAVVGYVEISSRPDFGVGALALIRRAFLLAGLGVSALATLVALWMSRSLTAPLDDLIQATDQMHSGALSTRATVHTQDEIGRLATQFNTMAARLERSFTELAAERDALSRFVADASHELRTPITALKTFGELLLGPAGDVPAARTEFLQESQKQIDRLERITSVLLNLSRLDAGLTNLKTEQVDLRDLLMAAIDPLVARAQAKGVVLITESDAAPIPMLCNPLYLEMALTNLIDNALKFTPTSGTVQVGIRRLEDWAALWVQDNGSGIAATDLPYIFDRFYRGLPGASTDTEAGSGLGLAIVQSIVKAHGGQVTVTSELGMGSRFVLQLPLAA